MAWATLISATVIFSGCSGWDDADIVDDLDALGPPDSPRVEVKDETDDGSSPDSSQPVPRTPLNPVIDIDPNEYASYLAEGDDDSGGNRVPREVKEISTQYENGNAKRTFRLQVFDNYPSRIHGEFQEWWENGTLWKKGMYHEGKQVGLWEFHNPEGQLVKSGKYLGGRPDGEWSFFRKDGTLQRIESYARGLRDGTWTEYDPTGKIAVQVIRFKGGTRHGTSTKWFLPQEGQTTLTKHREVHFVEGRQHGKAAEWYENGKLRNEVEFRNGKRHGRAAQWDERGNLVNELQFRDGEIVN
ncbi:MAG: hypothetical protein GTO26_07260 [Planctomycetales bacterium]|nr:hypothetical protein [Planctomycetales bacterium]